MIQPPMAAKVKRLVWEHASRFEIDLQKVYVDGPSLASCSFDCLKPKKKLQIIAVWFARQWNFKPLFYVVSAKGCE